MAHIHTEPGQHDITVGAYIIRTDATEPKIILHNHIVLRKLMHYGGHIELNESPWDAVLREVREEAGYDADQLKVLQPPQHLRDVGEGVTHPLPIHIGTYAYSGSKDHFHTDIAYAFIANGEPSQPIGNGESASSSLLSLADLEALPNDKVLTSVRQIGLFAFGLLDLWLPVPTGEYARS